MNTGAHWKFPGENWQCSKVRTHRQSLEAKEGGYMDWSQYQANLRKRVLENLARVAPTFWRRRVIFCLGLMPSAGKNEVFGRKSLASFFVFLGGGGRGHPCSRGTTSSRGDHLVMRPRNYPDLPSQREQRAGGEQPEQAQKSGHGGPGGP